MSTSHTSAVRSPTLVRVGRLAAVVIVVSTAAAGLPAGTTDRVAVVVLTGGALTMWLVLLDARVQDVRVLTACSLGTGLCGAVLDVIRPSGPGFILAYMALTAMGLRLPRRTALVAGPLVVAAAAWAEAQGSDHALSAALDLAIGAAFLMAASAFAAVSRDAAGQAQQLLAQQEATREAQSEAATLAERGRLARELHDILAHTMSGLTIQLEAAGLLADATGADPRLGERVRNAQSLAREGMTNARRAVAALRGDAVPGTGQLDELVRQSRLSSGLDIDFVVHGEPQMLPAEHGLTVYRTVQEALTNTAKYAGHGARAHVALRWLADSVEVDVVDVRGDGVRRGAPGGGYGLAGLAERAALAGGRLRSGPTDDGWRVHLSLPRPARKEPTA